MSLEWFFASHFESPFVVIENAAIVQCYFQGAASGPIGVMRRLERGRARIFSDVETSIPVGNEELSFSRSEYLQKLAGHDYESGPLVLCGASGVGKTALVKAFSESLGDGGAFLAMSLETVLSSANAGDMHPRNMDLTCWLDDLSEGLRLVGDDGCKYVVVDAAERFIDSGAQKVFRSLVDLLFDNGWKVIITSREDYLDELTRLIAPRRDDEESSGVAVLDIEPVSASDLREAAQDLGFGLPVDERLLRLLRYPMYLRVYLGISATGEKADLDSFRTALWDEVVMGRRSGFERAERHDALFLIAAQRARIDHVPGCLGASWKALDGLARDGVIRVEEPSGSWQFTKDIYEDAVVEKLVGRLYSDAGTFERLVPMLRDSPVARRGFRNWIGAKIEGDPFLFSNVVDVAHVLGASQLPWAFWLVDAARAMLASDSAQASIDVLRNGRYCDDRALMEGLAATMRAFRRRREAAESAIGPLPLAGGFGYKYVPYGSCWEKLIGWIGEQKRLLTPQDARWVAPLLLDWLDGLDGDAGKSQAIAGSIALTIYRKATEEDVLGSWDEERHIAHLALCCAEGIPDRVKRLLQWLVDGYPGTFNAHAVLASLLADGCMPGSVATAVAAPAEVAAFLGLYWKAGWSEAKVSDRRLTGMMKGDGVEAYAQALRTYGVSEAVPPCVPPSSFCTPLMYILLNDRESGLRLCIDFINHVTDCYCQSTSAKDIVDASIRMPDGSVIHQRGNFGLWCAYLGTATVGCPPIVSSVLMALERWLLNLSENEGDEAFVATCLQLVAESRSVAITAVVASAALAHPDLSFDTVMALNSSYVIAAFDSLRLASGDSARLPADLQVYRAFPLRLLDRSDAVEMPHRAFDISQAVMGYLSPERVDGCMREFLDRATAAESARWPKALRREFELNLLQQIPEVSAKDPCASFGRNVWLFSSQMGITYLDLNSGDERRQEAGSRAFGDFIASLCIARAESPRGDESAESTCYDATEVEEKRDELMSWAASRDLRRKWRRPEVLDLAEKQVAGKLFAPLDDTAAALARARWLADAGEATGLGVLEAVASACVEALYGGTFELGNDDFEFCVRSIRAAFCDAEDERRGNGLPYGTMPAEGLVLTAKTDPIFALDLIVPFLLHPKSAHALALGDAIGGLMWDINGNAAATLVAFHMTNARAFDEFIEEFDRNEGRDDVRAQLVQGQLHRIWELTGTAIDSVMGEATVASDSLAMSSLDPDELVILFLMMPDALSESPWLPVAQLILSFWMKKVADGSQLFEDSLIGFIWRKLFSVATADADAGVMLLESLRPGLSDPSTALSMLDDLLDARRQYMPDSVFWRLWRTCVGFVLESDAIKLQDYGEPDMDYGSTSDADPRRLLVSRILFAIHENTSWPVTIDQLFLQDELTGYLNWAVAKLPPAGVTLHNLACMLCNYESESFDRGVIWLAQIIKRAHQFENSQVSERCLSLVQWFASESADRYGKPDGVALDQYEDALSVIAAFLEAKGYPAPAAV